MKLFIVLFLSLFSLVAFSQSSKYKSPSYKSEMIKKYKNKNMMKYRGQKTRASNKKENKFDHMNMLKRGKKISHYIYADQSKFIKKAYLEEKKSFLKKLVNKLFGKIQVIELESSNENELKLRLDSKKDKYLVRKIYYKLGSIFSKTHTVETTLEGEDIVALIDISSIPVGEYKAYFKFIYEKNKNNKKNKKKIKLYSTYGYGVFEKKEKLINILADIQVQHDQNLGFVSVDASGSTSDAGDIVSFTYISLKDGLEINRFTSEYSGENVAFQESGTFEIQVEIEDSAGNKSLSEKRVVQITNATPITLFNVTQVEGLNGHFLIDASASSDFEDGKASLFRYVLYSFSPENEVEIFIDHYTTEDKYTIAVPEANKDYRLTVRAFDSTDQFALGDVVDIRFDGDGISPKLVDYYLATDENFPNIKYFGAFFSSSKPITQFVYSATHEDGDSLALFQDSSVRDSGVELTKPGLWTYEFYGIDEDGNKSDVLIITEENTWTKEGFIPVAIFNDIDISGHDPRIQYIYTGFEDKFGEVVSYSYTKAEHEDGTQIQALNVDFSNIAKEFRFPKKGTYNFTVVATDNDGNASEPYSFSYFIDWGSFEPVANFTLQPASSDPKTINVTEISSMPSKDITHILKATHESGSEINLEFVENFSSFQLDKFGSWSVEYKIRDIFGFISKPKIINLEVIRTQIDGDLIPPIPNKEINDSTIAGIDSDNDGVRDDVELWINNKFENSEKQRKAFKEIAKVRAVALEVSSDKLASIEQSRRLEEALVCAYAQVKADELDTSLFYRAFKEQKAVFLNTKNRILANIKYNDHLHGVGTSERVIAAKKSSRELSLCNFDQ